MKTTQVPNKEKRKSRLAANIFVHSRDFDMKVID